jgi:hypothetical protein
LDAVLILTNEDSLGSYYLYFLEICATAFFCIAFYLRRKRFYIFFTTLYLIVFLDDYLQIHENFGKFLTENFNLTTILSLRQQDTGELITWFIMACFLLPLAIYSVRKLNVIDKIYCSAVAVSFVILLFCGLVVDMISVSVSDVWVVRSAIGVIEEGGEIIAIALTVTLAFAGLKKNYNNKQIFKDQH